MNSVVFNCCYQSSGIVSSGQNLQQQESLCTSKRMPAFKVSISAIKLLIGCDVTWVWWACLHSAPLLANSPLKAELQLKAQPPAKPPKKSAIAGLLTVVINIIIIIIIIIVILRQMAAQNVNYSQSKQYDNSKICVWFPRLQV